MLPSSAVCAMTGESTNRSAQPKKIETGTLYDARRTLEREQILLTTASPERHEKGIIQIYVSGSAVGRPLPPRAIGSKILLHLIFSVGFLAFRG